MPRPRRGLEVAKKFYEKVGKRLGRSDHLRDALCFLGRKAPAANIMLKQKDFQAVRAFLKAHNIPHHFVDLEAEALRWGRVRTAFGKEMFLITMASSRKHQKSLKDCEERMGEFVRSGDPIPAELHLEYGALLGYPTPISGEPAVISHPAAPYVFRSLTKPVREDLKQRIAFLKTFPAFDHLENDPKRMLWHTTQEEHYGGGSGTGG